jgi:RNA recognition motif-containing protein
MENDSRKITPSPSPPPPPPPQTPTTTTTTTVYVGNLAPQVREDHLHKLLELCDCSALQIRRIHVCKHRDGVPKGYSFIEFDSASLAQQVIQQWNGRALCGRKLVVRPARASTYTASTATSTVGTTNAAPSSSLQLEREQHSLETKIENLKRVLSDRQEKKPYPSKKYK